MDQLDPKQQMNKPMFDVIEPSIVRAQFIAKRDVSFSSYLQPKNHLHNNNKYDPQTGQIRAEESDQISIFDAAKYFSGLHDQHSKGLNNIPPRLSSVSSSIDDNNSNYGGRKSNSNYRARSFHATPTASSEASWNSQTGLLANPPGSIGISIVKNLSPNSSSTTNTNGGTTPRWPRIGTKWLMNRRKCPCLGKKSVQVEERIESKTPRMVDLRRSTSSNGTSTTTTNASSFYSPRQYSPKNLGTTIPLASPSTIVAPQEPRNLNFNLMSRNPIINGGFSSTGMNPKVVGPLKLYSHHSEITGNATTAATTGNATISSSTSNGFTFPILENPPVGVKKMFNVIAEHHNQDPHRDSLEVFQPRNHPSPKSRRTSYEDENGALSDGSSDLFEIESFSTTYPCRDSMDEIVIPSSNLSTSMKRLGTIVCSRNHNNNVDENYETDEPMTPSVAPTECYAPSEVSIDWSVTTAEGFDRASLTNFSVSASEIGLYAAMRRESEKNGSGSGGGGAEGKRNKGNVNSGGLLSCRCEKAVSVGPGPIKCSAEVGPPTAARHVGGRAQQQGQGGPGLVNGGGNIKPSLVVGRSRSSPLPMPFAT